MPPLLKRWDGTKWVVVAGTLSGGGSGNDPRVGRYETVIGDGSTPGPYTIAHGLGSRSVDVQLYRRKPPHEDMFGFGKSRPTGAAGLMNVTVSTDSPLPECVAVVRAVLGSSDVTPPTAPTITSTGKTTTSIDVQITGGSDASGLWAANLYRDGVYVTTVPVGSPTTYTYTGLTPGQPYALTASVFDNAGNESAQSAPISVTTSAAAPNVARISNVRTRTVNSGTAAASITPANGVNKVLLAFVTLSHAAWQSEASLDVKTVSDSIDGAWTKLAVAEYSQEQTGQVWVFAKLNPTQLGTARTVTASAGKSGMANAHLIIDVLEFDNVASLGTPVTNAKNNSTLNPVAVTIPTTAGNATAAILVGSDANALVMASGTPAPIASTSNGDVDGTFDQNAVLSSSSTGSSTTYSTSNTKYASAAIGIDLVRAL